MANTKISQLTALTNPTWNEEFVYALNNANGKVTLDTMKTYTQTWTQEELVSWTNIKTINGSSILGSWNLVISWWGWWWDTIEITWTSWWTISEWTPVKIRSNWKIWVASNMNFVDDEVYMNSVVIDDASQSNVWLKTIWVWNDKFVSIFINSSKEICLCFSDYDWNNNPVNTWYKTNWAFDICSTKEWYATVIYREQSTQYPKVFAIDATNYSSWLSYWTAVGLENIIVKWNICIWITKVMDEDSTTFCALWQRKYTDQSATETGVTMYSLCSFNTSDLSITAWTPDTFLWNVNESWHIPFWYLWDWIVWMAFTDSSNRLELFAREYSNWTFGSAIYETIDTLTSWSLSTAPQLIWVWNRMCLLRAENMVYICSIRPDAYKLYEFCDVWSGWWNKRYYTVEWWKYVMCADMSRDMDNVYRSIKLSKYKVTNTNMIKIGSREHTLTYQQSNYPMPQILNYDNPRLSTDVDTDIWVYYIGASSSWIKRLSCHSDWWMCIWIAKENANLNESVTVITSWIAPWTFTWTWLPVYIWNWGTVTETPSEYLIWHTIWTTQFIFEWVKIV